MTCKFCDIEPGRCGKKHDGECGCECHAKNFFRAEVRRCEDVLNRAGLTAWDTTDEGIEQLARERDELKSLLRDAQLYRSNCERDREKLEEQLTKACLQRDSLKANRELDPPGRDLRGISPAVTTIERGEENALPVHERIRLAWQIAYDAMNLGDSHSYNCGRQFKQIVLLLSGGFTK
jgi:hypothetical protein